MIREGENDSSRTRTLREKQSTNASHRKQKLTQRKERQNKQVEIPNKFYLQDKEFGSQNVTNDAK